jgi:hypothetical protein
LTKSLRLAIKATFDHLVVCGDFNLPHIDWSTGTATNNACIHNYFTKPIKDNYLYQLIDFPTRSDKILDLVFTNLPDKVINIQGHKYFIFKKIHTICFKMQCNYKINI